MNGNRDQAPNDNQLGHNTTFWNEDNITHHESYDYDRDGNVSGLHYGQSDRNGSNIVYNYHTDRWEDHSK